MKTVAIAELKAKLSRYLHGVRHGDEVVVTDRGHAVARIVPPVMSGATPAELEEMIRSGLIRPGKGPLPRALCRPQKGAVDPKGSVLKALLEEREHGR
jgi:prevent-host-death family protein